MKHRTGKRARLGIFLFYKEAPNNRHAGQAQEQVLATDCEPNPEERLFSPQIDGMVQAQMHLPSGLGKQAM